MWNRATLPSAEGGSVGLADYSPQQASLCFGHWDQEGVLHAGP